MLKCKIWKHKWGKVDSEGYRECLRCKEKQKYSGYRLDLNRDDIRQIANNRVCGKFLKSNWYWFGIWFVLFLVYGAFTPGSLPYAILFILFTILSGVWAIVAFNKRLSKEIEKLLKEARKNELANT